MTTIGGLVSDAPRRGVQLYAPTAAQPRAYTVAPTSRTATPPKRKVAGFDEIDQQFMAPPEELAKRQQQQAKTHPPDLPWWQDTLGFVANTLAPLSVPMKAVTFGLEQATRHLPMGAREWLQHPTESMFGKNIVTSAVDTGAPLIAPWLGMDPEKVDADKRSFLNKIAPRSTYGSEAIYTDSPIQGLTGFRNLALDIGHDPLTYITGGERLVATGVEKGAEAAHAARFAEQAAGNFDTAIEAYAKALEQGSHPMLTHGIGQVADETGRTLAQAERYADYAAEQASRARPRVTHAPSTVSQRQSFIAELAGKDPELVRRFQDEFTKGINSGLGRMSPEAREAAGLAPRGLRIAGTDVRIPGTGKIVEGAGIVGSGLKRGTAAVLPESLKGIRTPETLAEARKMMRSKSTTPEMFQLAADYTRIINDIRLGSGEMATRGAQVVNREWRKEFRGMSEAERDAARVAAETSPEANKVNEVLSKLADIHEQITGRPFDDFSSISRKQYLPHIQTKAWAKWLKEHPDDPRAVAYRNQTGFRTVDELHTSGFIDRSRKLRLAPGETTKEIPLGDRVLRLNGNTVDDLNKGLAEAFPEFTGKFYETNLDRIFEVYSDALARDVGSRRAWKNLAESASPHGRVIEGDLAETLNKMNEALGTQSRGSRLRQMVESRGGQFTPGERLAVPQRTLAPGTKGDAAAQRFWTGYAGDLETALRNQDYDRIYDLTDEAAKHPLPRVGVEVLTDQGAADGFTWARVGGQTTQVPKASVALGPAGDIPVEHMGILTPRVSDTATRGLTEWADSGVPTQFAGQANTEANTLRRQALESMNTMRDNAYEGLRDEVKASSSRIKSMREAADEYVKQIKGMGKIDRNNAAEVSKLRQTIDKNIIDLEGEIKQRNSVWKGKTTREMNKIDAELNRQLRVLKEHSRLLDEKLQALPAEIRKEIRWRRDQLMEPVRTAKSNLDQAEQHYRMRTPPPRPEQISEARAVLQAHNPTKEFQQWRDQYRAVTAEIEDLRGKLSNGKLPKKVVREINAKVDQREAIYQQMRAATEGGTARTTSRGARDVQRLADLETQVADLEELQSRAGAVLPTEPVAPVEQLPVEAPADAFATDMERQYARQWIDRDLALKQDVEGVEETAAQLREQLRTGEFTEERMRRYIGAQYPGGLEGMRSHIPAYVAGYNPIDPADLAEYQATIREAGIVNEPGPAARFTKAQERKLDSLRRQRDKLAKTFEQGGANYDYARARETMANAAAWEQKFNEEMAPYQQAYDQAVDQMRNRPEALVYNRDKSRRFFDDELGRAASPTPSEHEGVFQARRVEPVEDLPQHGAYVTDVPGMTAPSGRPEEFWQQIETRDPITGKTVKRYVKRPSMEPNIPAGVQVPPQRTEQEALQALQRLAASPEQSPVGRYAAAQRQAIPIAEQTLPDRIANAQQAARQGLEAGRLTEVLPLEAALKGNQLNAVPARALDTLAEQLGVETSTRAQLRTLRDQYKSLPLGMKKIEVGNIVDDLEKFNAANPLLDDATRDQTSKLLQQYAADAERTASNRNVVNELGAMARAARNGKLKDEYLAGLADGWAGMHNGPVQAGDYIMDARLREMLRRVDETVNDPKLFGRIFNEATNVFKTYATLSPGFHARNAMSGIFMNAADGVSLSNQLEGWKLIRQYRKGGEEWLAKQPRDVREALTIVGGSGGGGRFTEAGFAGRADNPKLNKITRNRLTLLSQRAGEQVEMSLRMGMALDSVRGGQSAHEALERISKIHFDYGQLSKMDETMKRFVPFWTFMSRNLPMQMQMAYTKPMAYSMYGHAKKNLAQPDVPYTPEYFGRTGIFNTGASLFGNPLYVQSGLGVEQAGENLRTIGEAVGTGDVGGLVSEMNPWLVAPAQFAFKKDLYRGRQFGEADYSKASGPVGTLIKALAMALPGQTKQVNGETLVSDNLMNMLTKLIPPLSQTARIAPQSVGELGDAQRQAEALARYIGIPIRTLSDEQRQIEMRNQYYDALDKLSAQKKLARRAAA